MADDNDQQKTEAPTPRRRERAREEGEVLYSADLSMGLTLMIVAIATFLSGSFFLHRFAGQLRDSLVYVQSAEWGPSQTISAGQWVLSRTFLSGGVIAITSMMLSILWAHLQSGITLTTKPLSPNIEKLSPTRGWTRLMSMESAVRGGLSCLKLGTSVAVVIWIISTFFPELRTASRLQAHAGIALGGQLVRYILLGLAALTLFWGACDFCFRWYRFEQKLRMSKQEVKNENKDDQGDPQIRMRMRRAQMESRQRKALKEVPQATMVITNPTHYAVALKYEAGHMRAPIVLAKGTDALARRIARVARENGVPVFERKPLTRAIFALAELGDEIPAEFYRAIAELLAHVYRIKNAA
ncbi:flagellar type III secretion system protein FlhB [Thalassoglobus sp. JC818]|uniref:EscU/YscU/HrcU family type III secretion system export apparatus switch protein n=1 Tax=Thalassoglobus sp. JC818 TaxID=3232136 RepID=UPI0034587411